METVRIAAVGTAHPPHVIEQHEAIERVASLAGQPRRVRAIARGTGIRTRRTVLPAEAIGTLGSIAARNAVYREEAPPLALEASRRALGYTPGGSVSALVTSSCTGVALPGWGSGLVTQLGLSCHTMRLPVTEAGCAGGVVAMARAADYLRVHPGVALAAATEICSMAFHPDESDGNLTSTLIFGDGAGAARLETGDGPGLEVVDGLSMLVPETEGDLGFELTDAGFFPILSRRLTDIVVSAAALSVTRLLSANGLNCSEIGAWLIHPGGARILGGIERWLALAPEQTHWSRASMAEFGNTSSAAIFDVLRRYLEDADAPRGWGIVAAFGPGVAVELLLVRRTC